MLRALTGALARDFSYALRTLRQSPAFGTTAVLTIALGIGGSTAIFSLIRGVLLKPLEYRDPDRLVQISGGATPVHFRETRESARSLSGIGAVAMQENLTLTGDFPPEVVKTIRVSANFLEILGTAPLVGRGFLPAEDTPAAPNVAIISAELWQRRFDSDSHVVGRTIMLAGTPHTIVGILPARFQFPFPSLDVWLPQPAESPAFNPQSRALSPFLTVFGRLRPGISLEQANAEMATIQHRYAMSHPVMLDAKPKPPIRLVPLKEQLVSKIRSVLWMLFGAVGFVLLIACANVASLLLSRASARSREFAIRSALGASRQRLAGQLFVESILLSLGGGLLGMGIALFCLRGIPSITAIDLPPASDVGADWIVFGFAALLSVVTGILFGLAPSLSFSRPDITGSLRSRGEAANPGNGGSIRRILVVGQVALSTVLMIGAALLIESVVRLENASPGFHPEGLLTFRLSLPPSRYDTDQKRNTFFTELTRKLESLPGVRSATAAMTLPMTGFAGSPVQDASKPPLRLNERPIATILIVSPGYYRTLGIPLMRGRTFSDRDVENAPRAAVIDEGLARLLWPGYPAGVNPVGQRLLIGGTNLHPAEIVGIVRNVHQNIENTTWPGSVYLPFSQSALPSAVVAIRTQSDPAQYASMVREAVRGIDKDQPVSDIRTMEQLMETQLGQRRLLLALLASFAGAALVLALIGIYGVLSYSVAQRRQEIGIRRALGAREHEIISLILGQGLRLALAGVIFGLLGAFGLTRLMKSVLFQVSAADPATYACVACLFILAALAASYIPAYCATRLEPIAVLRNE
jgi:putative ABC transport system permease protein